MASGPLAGVRAVEFAGLAPVSFAGMILADLGADVVRVDRLPRPGSELDALGRGRRSVSVDLKSKAGLAVARRLVGGADVLLEGFRPGVMERLGLGPGSCAVENPRLVYGRMTGWGQSGPMVTDAGHDINYIAVAGALHPIGTADGPPIPPLNIIGDFGGGGMLLALGVVAALHERTRSGLGQVIDASMVDGAALLTTFFQVQLAGGAWSPHRGENLLDGSAPFYTCYETADGVHISVGAIEPHFYAQFVRLLGLNIEDLPDQHDRERWPLLRQRFGEVIRERTRQHWEDVFAGTDACVAPVLSLEEAPKHPRNRARDTFSEIGGIVQPGPAPRFSRTPPPRPVEPPAAGEHTEEVLLAAGFTTKDIASLRDSGVVH